MTKGIYIVLCQTAHLPLEDAHMGKRIWTVTMYLVGIGLLVVLGALDVVVAVLIVDGKIAPIGYLGLVGINAALGGAGWAAIPMSNARPKLLAYVGFSGAAICIGFLLYRAYFEVS